MHGSGAEWLHVRVIPATKHQKVVRSISKGRVSTMSKMAGDLLKMDLKVCSVVLVS
jgi:hypothetical protein